jgi:hypothetical protein
MQYKIIAAALGAASLLAMAITTAAPSAKSDYGVDSGGTTVTQGPGPTTMPIQSFTPAAKATPACGFMTQCDY